MLSVVMRSWLPVRSSITFIVYLINRYNCWWEYKSLFLEHCRCHHSFVVSVKVSYIVDLYGYVCPKFSTIV